MRKGTFRLLIAIAAVLAFAGTALGAGQVTLKTTVPNIPKSVCYQAGTITMEMDPETQIRIGDVLQFTTQNNTSLCKEIDYFLSLNGNGTFAGPTAPTAWSTLPLVDDTSLPVAGSSGQLVVDQAPGDYTSTIGAPFGTSEDRVYGFLVKGSEGSQIITMTFGFLDASFEFQTADPADDVPASVLRYTSTAAGTPLNPSDRFIIRLFDEKKNEGFFWKPDNNPADAGDPNEPEYNLTGNPATPPNEDPDNEFVGADNALCLDTLTEDYQGEFVEATPDSRPISASAVAPVHGGGFTLNFSGDYRIAKILPSLEYELAACKGAETGIIELPSGGQGAVADCSFSFESGAGYCTATDSNNLVIGSVGGTFPRGEEFILTLEILVNGQTGDRGVYFSADNITSQGYTILDDACEVEDDAGASNVAGTYYRADNATGTPTTDADCTVSSTNRFVRFTSQVDDLDLNETAQDDRFLGIDLPQFVYDTSVVQTDDEVAVRVLLNQEPCGTIFDGELELGTFGTCTGTGTLATQSLLYPYFTAADGTFFDSAFVIANIGNAAGGVTLYWYEADGDAFTGVVADELPANTIWNSGLMPQLVEDPGVTWTQTAGDGDQGDSMCYIVACTEFPSDGFAFIFGAPEGDSMGYIPRASATTAYGGAAECN